MIILADKCKYGEVDESIPNFGYGNVECPYMYMEQISENIVYPYRTCPNDCLRINDYNTCYILVDTDKASAENLCKYINEEVVRQWKF